MRPPLVYGYTPREVCKWEATHRLLAEEFPRQYDLSRDEAFVHRCVAEDVLDPMQQQDAEMICGLYQKQQVLVHSQFESLSTGIPTVEWHGRTSCNHLHVPPDEFNAVGGRLRMRLSGA